jgi:hypothetical protein
VSSQSLVHVSLKKRSSNIGVSGMATLLAAAMPKCPLCWIALMSMIGVSWPLSAFWLRSLTFVFMLIPLGLLLIRGHSAGNYRPFLLGLVAAIGVYLCKFRLNFNPGLYLSGAALFGASLWSFRLKRQSTKESLCRC